MRISLIKVNVCVNKKSGDGWLGLGIEKVGIKLGSGIFYPNFYLSFKSFCNSVKQDVVYFFWLKATEKINLRENKSNKKKKIFKNLLKHNY